MPHLSIFRVRSPHVTYKPTVPLPRPLLLGPGPHYLNAINIAIPVICVEYMLYSIYINIFYVLNIHVYILLIYNVIAPVRFTRSSPYI